MRHPACDFAKHMMQVALAQTGVWLSDGATNIMPIAPHRADRATLTDSERARIARSCTARGSCISTTCSIRW